MYLFSTFVHVTKCIAVIFHSFISDSKIHSKKTGPDRQNTKTNKQTEIETDDSEKNLFKQILYSVERFIISEK